MTTSRNADRQRPAILRRTPIAASLAACFGMAGLLADAVLGANAWAQSRPAPATVPQAPNTTYGAPIDYRPGNGGAVITQSAPTNIVSWKSFDIGSAAKVTVNQPSSTAVLLNKVEGGALTPTMIDGLLSGNGRVYIYNPNGVVFGKTSQVNVNALVASSLAFDENRVKGGLVMPGPAPTLAAASGAHAGNIVVEGGADGRAALIAANGGLLLLAAPNVINNGDMRAPDGQVILAAGNKVYLAAPSNSQALTLRGLVVEVSNDLATAAPGVAQERLTGTAENGIGASIQVGRGNATMIGYAVNQKGLVSATTSTTLNGSIYLYARDQARSEGISSPYVANRSGKVSLGENSLTQVLPALDDMLAFVRAERPGLPADLSPEAALQVFQALPTARQSFFFANRATVPGTAGFNPSEVKADGLNIELRGNAAIVAPGGQVSLTAARLLDNIAADVAADPANALINPLTNNVRVDLAPRSVIDVSGTTYTPMAMESNVITVDLRGTELADNVVLRNSSLYGSKAQIDIRNGNQAAGSAANVSGWLALVEKNLGQLTAAGGSVNIDAQGAIIQRPGSTIKVNGGWVDYLPGYVNTSKFTYNDGLVDIGAASANTLYTAIGTLPNSSANYEAGYRQGSSAGVVKMSAPIVVMQGGLSGSTVTGLRQRDPGMADYPSGARLEIGTLGNAYAGNAYLGLSNHAAAPQPGAPFDLHSADQSLLASRLDLDTGSLALQGFNTIKVATGGNIEIDTPVSLAAGGQLDLRAGVNTSLFSGGLLSPGGNLSVKSAVSIAGGSFIGKASGTLQVADGVAIDLAGRWSNDRVAPTLDANGMPTGAATINGGLLDLSVTQTNPGRTAVLAIGNDVSMDVSAGAWQNQVGKTSQGKAGSIALAARPLNLTSALAAGAQLSMGQRLGLYGYGFGSGGKLTMVGRNVAIGPVTPGVNSADLNLPASFFEQGGFSNYAISANLNFDILGNAVLTPRSQSWQFNPNSATLNSGAMRQVATPVLLGLNGNGPTRAATNLSFQAPATPVVADGKPFSGGTLTVRTGAQVLLDPGASLNLLAGQQLTVDGTLSAPGGAIALMLPSAVPGSGSPVFRPERSIWFGPHARVLASGSSERLTIGADKVASGELLDGGSIEIGDQAFDPDTGKRLGAFGYVVAEAGSMFDVSGVYAGKLSMKAGSLVSAPQEIASNGGRITIRTREGMLFNGTLSGSAGGASASGGALNIGLEGDGGTDTALDPRVLTVGGKAPALPDGWRPGQPLAVDLFAKDGAELGWFLSGSAPGDANPLHLGQGWLPTASFANAGFGSINLKAEKALAFGLGSGNLTLSARDSLILDAPLLLADTNVASTVAGTAGAHTLTLAAPYVRLGSGDVNFQLEDYLLPGVNYRPVDDDHPAVTQKPSVGGNATLLTQATTVDLIGNSATQGFGNVTLAADADIRMIGLTGSAASNSHLGYATGSLSVAGNLTLKSAQSYPTTLSDFTLNVTALAGNDQSGLLKFESNGQPGQPVYSAAGSLIGLAPTILQAGHVLAPFGQIRFGDQDTLSLHYAANSLTSVAGVGNLPFGVISNSTVPGASSWNVALNDGGSGSPLTITLDPHYVSLTPERLLLPKAIVSQAQSITTDASAVLDASGGGALSAYAFTAGKGGSRDVLSSNTPVGGKDTVFAINPTYQGAVAPVDGEGSGGLAAGQRVYLSGVPGLAAGYYTLLPAHYALLPGGFSISAVPNTRDLPVSGNMTLPDGSMLVSGHLASGPSNPGSNRSSAFLVMSGKVVRSKSEYGEFDASQFFTAQAKATGRAPFELPRDGGYLAFNVNPGAPQLSLMGRMPIGAAPDGRPGYADFTAPSIGIVGDRSQSATGGVTLTADQLTGLGADSILIGALRDGRDDGMHVLNQSKNVTLSNNAEHPLSAAEITLVASDTVKLEQGAVLAAGGQPSRAPQDLLLDGAGALLRVSSGAAAGLVRSHAASQGGNLMIGNGATVRSGGTAYLDATAKMSLSGTLDLAPGSALWLSARGIDLGSDLPTGAGAAGAQFDTTGLSMLSKLSQLELNSYDSTINLYGSVNLGSTATSQLTLRGAGLRGYAGSSGGKSQPLRNAVLTATTVRFEGQGGSSAAVADSAGMLAVQAGEIDLGSQSFALHGFADAQLSARGELLADGKGGQLSADRNLTLSAARFSTTGGSDGSFVAGNTLKLSSPSGIGLPTRAPGQGGALSFYGYNLASDARIAVPSGQVAMAAGLELQINGGQVSVAGTSTDFAGTPAYAPAGRIDLSAFNVSVGNGAVLDLSAKGAAAGSLTVNAHAAYSATGNVQVGGQLLGTAQAGADGIAQPQGRFTLNADNTANIGSFRALNQLLNGGGFTESRHFNFLAGDITMSGNDRIVAQDVVLATDRGNITIGGNAVIDASGDKGGSIALYAGQLSYTDQMAKVTLSERAQLLAHGNGVPDSGAGSVGNGGRVLISISNGDDFNIPRAGGGSIRLDGGSIDVGGAPDRMGSVTLRAPRYGFGVSTDLAIASLNSRILGSADTVLEGYQVYNASTISEKPDSNSNLNAGTGGKMYTDANQFVGNKKAILARLGAGAAAVRLAPGIEVRSAGDLTVSVNEMAPRPADRGWDLHAWRFGNSPVSLTLRALGNLAIQGSISDGFIKPAKDNLSMPDWSLASDLSASYRLVGGARLGAANPLDTEPGSKGDVLFQFAPRTPTSAAPLSATDAPVAVVRTGTGRIDVAAARDISLSMAKFWRNSGTPDVNDTPAIDTNVYAAAVYTAGQNNSALGSFVAPLNSLNPQYGAEAGSQSAAAFGRNGGAISLTAGRDVLGPYLDKVSYHLPGTAAEPPDPDIPKDPGTPAIPGDVDYLPGTVPQLINNWLFRQGRSYVDAKGNTVFETLSDQRTLRTAWWSRTDYFDQGVATLGGGDLSVVAGRHISDLSASVASNAFVPLANTAALREQGGGDLLVRAGGNILGGVFYVQKGNGLLHADGDIGSGHGGSYPYSPDLSHPLAPVLALGDAHLDVSAGGNLRIEGTFNPTQTAQSVVNRGVGNDFSGVAGVANGVRWDVNRDNPEEAQRDAAYRQKYAQFSNFSTYGVHSAVQLTAIGGDLSLSNDAKALSLAGIGKPASPASIDNQPTMSGMYLLAPATFRAAALNGDLSMDNGFVLAAAPRGQLDLLASGNINLHGTAVRMLDNDPAGSSQALTPRVWSQADLNLLIGATGGIAAHTLGGLHAGDNTPVHVIARDGDIVGDGGNGIHLALPKTAQIVAGRDIRDLGFEIQQLSASDVLTVTAGRDFIDSTPTSPNNVYHSVSGAGRVVLSAGRNVDLGNGGGLVTRGNLDNVYLAEGGAAISVVAGGAKPDYAALVQYANQVGFVSDLATSLAALTASEQRDLVALVRAAGVSLPADASAALAAARQAFAGLKPELQAKFLGANTDALRSFVQAQLPKTPAQASPIDLWMAFHSLPQAAQQQFLSAHPAVGEHLASSAITRNTALDKQDLETLNQQFFRGLVETSQANKDSKFKAFDDLIASLYPTAGKSGGGDIALYNSQIKTEQGGAIDLFAPAGSVYAGLTVGVSANNAAKQGLFTIQDGAIRALVKNDFLVNQGRVFTLGGGDITLVSQSGNIDAGRGAKTATSAPPPRVTIDANGSVKLDVSSSISGSGIATLKTRADQLNSNVYAVAPRGIFDAGDAGVRSSGSVQVVAPVVRNSDNIAAAGSISGAAAGPAVAAPSAAPALPANSNNSDQLGQVGAGADLGGNSGKLEVEVLGYGADDGSGDTEEEKKRRKAKEAKKAQAAN